MEQHQFKKTFEHLTMELEALLNPRDYISVFLRVNIPSLIWPQTLANAVLLKDSASDVACWYSI